MGRSGACALGWASGPCSAGGRVTKLIPELRPAGKGSHADFGGRASLVGGPANTGSEAATGLLCWPLGEAGGWQQNPVLATDSRRGGEGLEKPGGPTPRAVERGQVRL